MHLKTFLFLLCLPSITSAQDCARLNANDLANAINQPPAFCGTSTDLSGQQSQHCAWEYGYRDANALAQFTQLSQRFDQCHGPRIEPDKDARVNHPDSYTLHQYHAGTSVYSLSLKDKAGPQKTLIFVRHFAR
jgi:hypothetical protein